jgi:FlaA1/EpsC-like NDP-sugar epimerase
MIKGQDLMSMQPLSPRYISANENAFWGSEQAWRSLTSRLHSWLTRPVVRRDAATTLVVELFLLCASLIATVYIFAGSYSTASEAILVLLPAVMALRGSALIVFGVFRRSLRYASATDVLAIAEAIAWSSAAWYLLNHIWTGNLRLSGTALISDTIVSFSLLTCFHFGFRIYCRLFSKKAECAKRVIVAGAGDAGASVVDQLLRNRSACIRPVAIIDDDVSKKGTQICGVPVVGTIADLKSIVFRHAAAEVLVCIPSASDAQRSRLLLACRECGVPVRTLPTLPELVSGQVSYRDLRAVDINDLLKRQQSPVDDSLSRDLVRDRVVLVTGAGGSIGSELSKQLAAAGPRRLILLDKSENNLFYSHRAVQEASPTVETEPVLADILDEHALGELFERERPDLVFHAAAFKHVGMMELHPYQAIRNNVLGTWNLLQAASRIGVDGFVNISTDKAVNPSCYMGLSKKLAEQLVRAMAVRHNLPFMNVRFGNVAGSSGSVLQIFSEQIKHGGPLQITDPRASRYFMSIAEAVGLVLCAAKIGEGGETFILDMGDPINIFDLACTLSLYSGFAPEEELPIQFTGLRKGEKVHEELWEPWETPQPTKNAHIRVISGVNPVTVDMFTVVEKLQEMVDGHEYDDLTTYIAEIIPTFAAERASLTA